MKLCYMAHPVSAATEAEISANLKMARYWYKLLCNEYRDRAFTANWIINCEVFEETEDNREIGMRRNFAELVRCDELFLVGGRISRGMIDEIAVFQTNKPVFDLTNLSSPPAPHALARYIRAA